MRKSAKALLLIVISFSAAVGLAVASFFSAALSYGAIALIVPGTGTPNANIVDDYKEQARNRFLTTTACGPTGANCPDDNLLGIDYPASFFPLIIFPTWCRSGPNGCDTWDESVGMGAAALQAQLEDALETDEDIVIFGYSQGGAVVANVLSNYVAGLPLEQRQRIDVVTIGGIENPDGGLWQRLSFLQYIPILNISFNPPVRPIEGVNETAYVFHFDPVGDAPRYLNPFSLLNAAAALFTVHGLYLSPNGNGPDDTLPYGYTDETLAEAIVCNVGVNCRVDAQGNQYVIIPATSLPIADYILSSTPAPLLPLVKPLVDLVAPAYRVLAELGYDYSGDPSVPTPFSILPFSLSTNPLTVATDLVAAVIQGIQEALGGVTMLAPTIAPPSNDLVNARAFSAPADPRTVGDSSPAAQDSVKSTPLAVVDPAPVVEPTKTTPVTSVVEEVVEKPLVDATVDDQKDEPKKDDVEADELETDEELKTEATTDEATTDEPKKDEPKKDEAKKDEAKKDDDENKDADAKAAA